MAIYCLNCGVELPEGVAFCDACGTPVRGQQGQAAGGAPIAQRPNGNGAGIGAVACPVCGAGALPGEAFCDNCGASLLAPAGPAGYAPASIPPSPAPTQAAPPVYAQGPTVNYPSTHLTPQIIVKSPPPPATITVPDKPELIVGRSDQQSNSYPDVDLGPYGGLDLGVSRRHFRLTRNNDQFYIEDLNSMNGSIVNSQRIPPYTLQPLRSGDQIILGKMELAFELS